MNNKRKMKKKKRNNPLETIKAVLLKKHGRKYGVQL
jgi:hypothetical protein